MKITRSQWIQSLYPLVLFGSVPVFIEMTQSNPIVIGSFRLSLAALLIFIFSKGHKATLLAFKNNLKIFIIMGAVFWVHWITYFLAIKGSSASYGLLGLSTYGIQLSLISAYIAKQHLSKTNKLSLGIIFIGLVLIQNPFAAEFTWNTGLVWGTISAFFYALIPILHKKHVEIPLQHRVFGMFSTTAFFFLLLTPLGNWGQLGVNDLYLLLFLGIGGTFIAHTLWVNYTTVNPGWVSGLLYYQVIPITLLLNYLINDENHSLSKILGSVLLLFANLISILKSNSKKKL